jgi:hypothetical protein
MQPSTDELVTLVRRRVCRTCAFCGPCVGFEKPASCSLFRLFPLVARAIQSSHGQEAQNYVQAIRQQVCSVCAQREPNGSCEAQTRGRCVLDSYPMRVVEAFEEASDRSFEHSKARQTPALSAG